MTYSEQLKELNEQENQLGHAIRTLLEDMAKLQQECKEQVQRWEGLQ